MTTPGRKGWLAKLQNTMAPLADPDDDSPIVRPPVVIVSMVLAILSGAVFLYAGIASIANIDTQVNGQRDLWVKVVAQCEADPAVGTIGDAVPSSLTATPTLTSPVPATSLEQVCKQIKTPQLDEATASSMRSQLTIISVIFMVLGAAVVAGGVLMRSGSKWSRRILVTVALLTLGVAMLLQISTAVTLAATLLLVVAIMLVYAGKGGLFFARTLLQQRRQH